MSDFYDRNSLSYFQQTACIVPEAFLKPFTEFLPPRSKIFDVGCGSGRDLLWLRKRGYQAKGLERSPALAKLASVHSGCEVFVGDFMVWDFAAHPVDGILLIGALVHIPHESLAETLIRIADGLKPEGKVLLTIKEGRGVSERQDGRVFYLWEEGDLRGLLISNGFEVLHFQRDVSAVRDEDIWLTYVLEKGADGGKKDNPADNSGGTCR